MTNHNISHDSIAAALAEYEGNGGVIRRLPDEATPSRCEAGRWDDFDRLSAEFTAALEGLDPSDLAKRIERDLRAEDDLALQLANLCM